MLGFIFKALVSPLVLLIIAILIVKDFREAYLIALLIYTVLSLIGLLQRLLRNARIDRIFSFMFTVSGGLFYLISLVVYWELYVLAWGWNFNLDKTFAIFK